MVGKETLLLHEKIADRAQKLGLLYFSRLSLLMDLEAAQIAFNLDCERLLEADNFNFAHDICGIQRHIDRKATEFRINEEPHIVFKGEFLPRFARN